MEPLSNQSAIHAPNSHVGGWGGVGVVQTRAPPEKLFLALHQLFLLVPSLPLTPSWPLNWNFTAQLRELWKSKPNTSSLLKCKDNWKYSFSSILSLCIYFSSAVAICLQAIHLNNMDEW